MTLQYEMRDLRPPARTGLIVYGVITLLVGMFFVLGALGSAVAGVFLVRTMAGRAAVVMPAPAPGPWAATTATTTTASPGGGGATTVTITLDGGVTPATQATVPPTTVPAPVPPPGPAPAPVPGPVLMTPAPTTMMMAVILGIAAVYLVVGLIGAWMGIDMIRGRRWVRPVVLTLSGGMLVSVLAGLPGAALGFAAAFNDVSAGMRGSPFGGGAMAVGILFTVVFWFGVPLAYFLFFRRPQCAETLRYLQPTPSWTDAWTVPMFALGVAAAFVTVTGGLAAVAVASAWATGWVRLPGGAGAIWAVTAAAQVLLSGATAVACFRTRWGRASAAPAWRLALTSVVVYGVGTAVLNLAYPQFGELQASGLRSWMSSDFQGTTRSPAAIGGTEAAVAAVAAQAVYAGALIVLRRRSAAGPVPTPVVAA